jgi:hypothetical protein
MNWPRFLVAFLVAPAAPALLFVIPGLLTSGSGVLAIFLIASIVCYAHGIALGVPVAWLLAHSKSLTLLRVVSAAFFIGALPFAGFTVYQELTMPPGAGYISNGAVLREDGRLTSAGLRSTVFGVLQCGLLGATAGLLWWMIAGPRTGVSTTDG